MKQPRPTFGPSIDRSQLSRDLATTPQVRALVACEYSGIVRDQLTRAGAFAVSCDLEPTLSQGPHYTGDISDLLQMPFDILIGHPPCTFLCSAQLWRCMREPARMEKQKLAADFFMKLYNSSVPCIALENPKGAIPRYFRPYDQQIQPWHHGDPYTKEICLWLKNLPPLIGGPQSTGRKHMRNHTNGRMSQALKSKIHSRFYPGIAAAMAAQWLPMVAKDTGRCLIIS